MAGLNVATALCYWNAQMLTQLSEPQISKATGGEVETWHGMHPDGRALGFRTGQKATYTITFTTPKLAIEANQEVDWQTLADNHTEGVFEVAPLGGGTGDSHECKVVSCELGVDKNRSMDWTVVLASLGKIGA